MAKYKECDEYSNDLADRMEALLNLYEMMPRTMPSGSVVQLELEDGNHISVSKKQLKLKRAEMDTDLRKTLPKMFKRAGKRRRKTDPSDFTGAYTPVIVAEAMQEFVKTMDLGHEDPTDPTSPNLIDLLPCIAKGWGLRNSFQLLWFISIYNNRLQDNNDKTMLKSNEAMLAAFGSNPAKYTNFINDDGKIKTRDNTDRLTTFEVLEYRATTLEHKEIPFDRTYFKIYAFPIILSINIFRPEDLTQDLRDALRREDLRQELLKEFQIIKEAKTKWKAHILVLRKQEAESD